MKNRTDKYNIDGNIIDVAIMTTRKDVLDYVDEYVENLNNDCFDSTDESFEIIYKDGTSDFVDSFYDGHKIKRQNIKSILYNNPCDYIVFGEYVMNKYGVAHAV